MKKSVLASCFLFLLFNTLIMGQSAKSTEVQKELLNRIVDISSKTEIYINNKFGNIKVLTWDKNKAEIKVTATAKSSTKEKALLILNRISLTESSDGNQLAYITNITEENGQVYVSKLEDSLNEMSTTYTLYIPENVKLNLVNQFGNIDIPDYNGETKIQCTHGNLNAGSIKRNSQVIVEFGKAAIREISGGKISFKFASTEIQKLSGVISANFEFCLDVNYNHVKLKLDASLKDLTINSHHSNLDLLMEPGLPAKIKLATSFSEVVNESHINLQDNEIASTTPKFDFLYTGIHSAGTVNLNIDSKHGNLKLGNRVSKN
jgi:hypothetical protein